MFPIYLTNVLAGSLAGLLCSLGGALKDSPYEGFSPRKFPRSLLVGTAFGCLTGIYTANPVIAFCMAGYLERVAVEGYKILRAHRPGKFDLPHPSDLGRALSFKRGETT